MIWKILAVAIGISAVVVLGGVLYEDAPRDGDNVADVVMLMGQSNAMYRAANADWSIVEPAPEGMAYYFGRGDRPNYINQTYPFCTIHPMTVDGRSVLAEKWPALASAYIDATGHKVVLTNAARGSQSIRAFSPTLPGQYWDDACGIAKGTVEAMKAYGLELGTFHVVWIQGEHDNAIMSAEDYKDRLLELGTTILNGGLGVKVAGPIWVSQTRGEGGATTAQAELAAEKPGMFQITTVVQSFTIANGLMSSDDLHYSQAGNNILGEAIGSGLGESVHDADRTDRALWGIIGIGVIFVIAAACLAIYRR